MKRSYSRKPGYQTKMALKRIKKLFEEAETAYPDKLSDRYVELARQISMKYKVRIPAKLKKRFCKHCHSYLMPGENVRIRLKNGMLVYNCLECGKYMRFKYKRHPS